MLDDPDTTFDGVGRDGGTRKPRITIRIEKCHGARIIYTVPDEAVFGSVFADFRHDRGP
jgi:hypothetical protein